MLDDTSSLEKFQKSFILWSKTFTCSSSMTNVPANKKNDHGTKYWPGNVIQLQISSRNTIFRILSGGWKEEIFKNVSIVWGWGGWHKPKRWKFLQEWYHIKRQVQVTSQVRVNSNCFSFYFFAIFCFPTFFFNHTPEAEVLIQRQDEIQTDEISCFNCSKR